MRRIVAEFFLTARGKYELFSLWVWEAENKGCDVYDVDYSKRNGYCFHMSGGGFTEAEVSGPYWTNAPELAKARPCRLVGREARKRNKTRRMARLPRHLQRDEYTCNRSSDLLAWLENNAIHSDTVYCSKCRDRLPTSDTDYPCEHIWWCESKLDWSTPSERTNNCTDEECDCRKQEPK